LKSADWLDPWLDEEKISLGQHWTTIIEDALDAADCVIIFLSKNSIQKEGFLQRELNYAWEVSLKKPKEVIFLIPFRLDDCEVPRDLRARQWGDYFGEKKEKTYDVLLRSLKERYDQILLIEAKKRVDYEKQPDKQIVITQDKKPSHESIIDTTNKKNSPRSGLLPDFRVRQRDYLLEISRALTQELDLEKLLARTLRVSIEMLAGQAGVIILRQPEGWNISASHGVATAFLDYLKPLLAEENVRELEVAELNRMLKELTYTASKGLLNGTNLPLVIQEQVIGVIFVLRNYQDLFTPNDRSLLQSFSDQAAIAIKNANLFKDATANKD
jgi:hypothetical protein